MCFVKRESWGKNEGKKLLRQMVGFGWCVCLFVCVPYDLVIVMLWWLLFPRFFLFRFVCSSTTTTTCRVRWGTRRIGIDGEELVSLVLFLSEVTSVWVLCQFGSLRLLRPRWTKVLTNEEDSVIQMVSQPSLHSSLQASLQSSLTSLFSILSSLPFSLLFRLDFSLFFSLQFNLLFRLLFMLL